MRRYYFDFREGDGLATDEEGAEFPNIESAQENIESAQEEATQSLADMAKGVVQRYARNPLGRRMTIDVRDDAGPVMNVGFAFEIDRMK